MFRFATKGRHLGMSIACPHCGCRNEIPTVNLGFAKILSVLILLAAAIAAVYLVWHSP
jgi:hypothetical protein